MAGFVQIMEFDTSRIEELEAFSKKMHEERGDALLASRATITADRDRSGHYYIVVEFDSFEVAMRNSNDPETAKYAAQMGEFLDGPPTFHNLDVVMVMETGK